MLERKPWFIVIVCVLSSFSTAFLLSRVNVSLGAKGPFSAEFLTWVLCFAGFERIYREGVLLALAMIKPEWVKQRAD
jgi:hypothetical protein